LLKELAETTPGPDTLLANDTTDSTGGIESKIVNAVSVRTAIFDLRGTAKWSDFVVKFKQLREPGMIGFLYGSKH
jgi:hypothetical protein